MSTAVKGYGLKIRRLIQTPAEMRLRTRSKDVEDENTPLCVAMRCGRSILVRWGTATQPMPIQAGEICHSQVQKWRMERSGERYIAKTWLVWKRRMSGKMGEMASPGIWRLDGAFATFCGGRVSSVAEGQKTKQRQ